MPEAATVEIGHNKSLPIVAFSWGPPLLNQYSVAGFEQYAYLWAAILKPDKRQIELYQAVDASGEPWRHGAEPSGGGYVLRKTIDVLGTEETGSQDIKYMGLCFSPNGKPRFGLIYEDTAGPSPTSILKFAAVKDDTLFFAHGIFLWRCAPLSVSKRTGLVMLNTFQLHGRMGRAFPMAVVGIYRTDEDATSLFTISSPIDTIGLSIHQSPPGPVARIPVVRKHFIARSSYLAGEWYISALNPIVSPADINQLGNNGQILLYSPASGETQVVKLRPTIKPGFYRKPKAIGQDGQTIGADGLDIGAPGEVEIGDHQYAPQSEGISVISYIEG